MMNSMKFKIQKRSYRGGRVTYTPMFMEDHNSNIWAPVPAAVPHWWGAWVIDTYKPTHYSKLSHAEIHLTRYNLYLDYTEVSYIEDLLYE